MKIVGDDSLYLPFDFTKFNMKKSSSNKKPNKWLVFVSLPFQMGITICLFYWIGQWIDTKYAVEGEWWSKGLGLLGVLASLYHFIRQVNHINRHE